MRRSRPSDARRPRQRGFTLIEAVMVIAISGVVIAMVALFIAPATSAYFASSARAQLSDEADTALRRISRDLAGALPNSTRITGQSLELIPVSGAARYAVDAGDILQFGMADTSFDIVGPALRLASANQRLAWYNLGAGITDADAYNGSNVRVASSAAGSVTNVTISNSGSTGLSGVLKAPPYRVYAIDPPVTYRCDTTAQTLTRHSGYGFLATQADLPSGGNAAVLARHISSCTFSYDQPAITSRYALVTMRLQLTANGETVTLYHTVHVDNLP